MPKKDMSTQQKDNRERRFLIGLLIFTAVPFLIGFYVVMALLSQKPSIYSTCRSTAKFLSEHRQTLQTLIPESFAAAKTCSDVTCRQAVRAKIFQSLPGSDQVPFFPSSYFIRLNEDGNIEKLLWTGELRTTLPKTGKERTVVKVLLGTTGARCIQGWKMDGENTSMTYLKDFHSEAEIIQPIKNDRNQVVGALVTLYGD